MNNSYRYSLDKTSKKFVCPNCNKKTFVKFIINETKYYLNGFIGRCDRESKCGYFKKPDNNFVAINDTNCITEVIKPTYHNETVLQQFNRNKQYNNFTSYLFNNFKSINVLQAIEKYCICNTSYWYGATVFWQIDTRNRVRGGKIMLYNCDTGKRVKKPFNHVSWIHKQLKLDSFVLQQCLFGLHNVNCIAKDDTICIVESEKTAIIMSIVLPNFLWLATGSKAGFKEEMLKPIKEYKIITYPDKSEYSLWNTKAVFLNKRGFKIQCSSLLENLDLDEGVDLVDFLIHKL